MLAKFRDPRGPKYIFFTTFKSKKLLLPSNFFLRKQGAKVITNKKVTDEKIH